MTLQGFLTLALFAWYFIATYISAEKKNKETKAKYEEQKKIMAAERQKDRENIYKAIQDLGEKLNENKKEN